MEDEIRAAVADFVGRIGNLGDEPEARAAALRIAVRETSWRLFEEFGDHYALAEQLEIMSRLAWRGPDALRAAAIASTVTERRTAEAGAACRVRPERPRGRSPAVAGMPARTGLGSEQGGIS